MDLIYALPRIKHSVTFCRYQKVAGDVISEMDAEDVDVVDVRVKFRDSRSNSSQLCDPFTL